MFIFFLSIIGNVITGGSLVNSFPYHDVIVFGVMGCLFISYIIFFCVRKKNLRLISAEKCLVGFLVIGLLYVLLSYLGVYQGFSRLDLYFDKSYIPRQAVYMFVLPAVILFQDEYYTKGKDYILSHYGEILFWCLYAAGFIYQDKTIFVSTQLILCWMALRIISPQRWRNWVRFVAVLIAPLPRDGSSTILFLRLLFAGIIMVPLCWKRQAIKWASFVLLAVVILVSFAAPILITDTSWISDVNTLWRMNYWIDELQNLRNTYGLGVGYGTSYPSVAFAETFGYFYATSRAGIINNTFVRACHNSFVAVAMRTGILGVTALLLFIVLMLWEMLRYKVLPTKAAFFALFGAVVCIAFNVGLESPNYLFSFVFCFGECNQEVHRVRKESRVYMVQTGVAE